MWPKWFLIIHQNEYVYEKVDLWLAVDGENVKGLDGHAECLLSDFTDEDETTGDEDGTHSQTSMGLMATEAISTAILKEKKWVLHLYLIPESHDHNDDEWDVQYLQTKNSLRTNLDKEFEHTYKGFASFEFNTDDDTDCITIRSP